MRDIRGTPSWSPREANRAVHILASWSKCNRFGGCFALGAAPAEFSNVIFQEQAHPS